MTHPWNRRLNPYRPQRYSWRKHRAWAVPLFVAFVSMGIYQEITHDDADAPSPPPPEVSVGKGDAPPLVGRVTSVADGDTINVVLRGGAEERVRYIGIGTPELGECFGDEAARANRGLVEGKDVELQLDLEERDRYGRLLAYVFLEEGGINVAAWLLARGYARTLEVPPNTRLAGILREFEDVARDDPAGLWAHCE